jgi:hypothetical protein
MIFADTGAPKIFGHVARISSNYGSNFGLGRSRITRISVTDSLNFDRFSLFQRLACRGLCKIISQQQHAYCTQILRNLRRRSSAKFVGQTYSRNHNATTKALVSSYVF